MPDDTSTNDTTTNDTSTAPPPLRPPGSSNPFGRLRRSTSDRFIAGVAGGLAQAWGIDPIFVRVAFVVASAFGGFGVFAYLVAWAVLPPDDGTPPLVRRRRPDRGRLFGIALLAIGVIALIDRLSPARWQGDHLFWPLALILGGIAVLVLRANDPRTNQPVTPDTATFGPDYAPAYETASAPDAADGPAEPLPPPPTQTAWNAPTHWPTTAPPWQPGPPAPPFKRRARRREPSFLAPLTFSALLVFIGLATLADVVNAVSVDPAVVAAVCLAAIGTALAVGAWYGRARILIVPAILLTVVCAGFASIDVPVRGGIGGRRYRPITTASVADTYRLGIGALRVNLRDVPFERGTTRLVHVQVGIGYAQVLVPSDVALVIDGHSGAGAVDLANHHQAGTSTDDHVVISKPAGAATLHIDARVGLGQVRVLRPADQPYTN
ncbi:MAG: PspC protein [Actinomycetia bacterium]|nr:PspC protein [Actinomycetes bacterium]